MFEVCLLLLRFLGHAVGGAQRSLASVGLASRLSMVVFLSHMGGVVGLHGRRRAGGCSKSDEEAEEAWKP